jgi:ferric-dicitrate binding protein FerR (iron transport regulator)
MEWMRFTASVEGAPVKRIPGTGRIMVRLAAAVVAGLIIGYSSLLVYRGIKYDNVKALAGIETVTLPDGSSVTLNEGSSLRYPKVFRDDRTGIKLRGEGFFEVESDPERKFAVSSGGIIVEVLGTAFNIDASSSDNSVSVIVSEGKVAVYNKADNTIVRNLTKGEKAVYSTGKEELVKSVNTDVNFDSYKTRRIVFNNTGINNVINTLNRVYPENIISNIDAAEDYVLTVTFEDKDLGYVLQTIEATLGLSIEKEGENIIFR